MRPPSLSYLLAKILNVSVDTLCHDLSSMFTILNIIDNSVLVFKFPCYRILTFLRHYILPFITLLAFSATASEIIVLFFAKPIDVYYMLCYNNFIRSIRCECMGVLRKYLLSLYRCKCLKYHKILYDVKLIKSLQITRRWQIKRWKLQNPPKISLKLTKCPRKIPCKNSLWEILLLQF